MPSTDLSSFLLGKVLAERAGLNPGEANSWGALQMQLGLSVTGVLVVQELIRRDVAALKAADPIPAQTERLIAATKRATRAATRATKAANAARTATDNAIRAAETTIESAKQVADAAEKIVQIVQPKPTHARRNSIKKD